MLNVYSFSEAGGHGVNEDAFIVERAPGEFAGWICFLADGQGGRAGGARAANLACQVGMEEAQKEPAWKRAAPSTWPMILHRADLAVCSDHDAGLTTLIGFQIGGDKVVGASCGDSGVLVATGAEPPQVLTGDQPKNPPVGSGEAKFAQFGAKLVTPWVVLAVSDGVWKYAGWERIVEAVQTQRGLKLLECIQGFARLRGSGAFADDFTVVLFEGAG